MTNVEINKQLALEREDIFLFYSKKKYKPRGS